MNERKIYACDFETSVYKGQKNTEVWASGYCEIGTHKTQVWNNIDDFMKWALSLKSAATLYFHNLKFDGSFIVSWLLSHGYKYKHCKAKELKNSEFTAIISNEGQWYKISLPTYGSKGSKGSVEIRDSLKLLPFALRKLTNDFDVEHKKLEMEYVGERHAGYEMSENERAYFENDLYGLAECLEECFSRGMTSLTIGSECMKEYKKGFEKSEYSALFPDLTEIPSPFEGEDTDDFCRAGYRGGWCYVNPDRTMQIIPGGITLDVNSLYPSVMHSEGGCYYPVGRPRYYTDADFIKWYVNKFRDNKDEYFYVRFKCSFEIKPGYLPTIQIHKDIRFNPRQYLFSSGPDGIHRNNDGTVGYNNIVTLTLTKTDFYLFMEHYNVEHVEFMGIAVFQAVCGLFDNYLDYWRDKKINAKNKIERTLAKLYMNNLYGKTAASDDSSYKVPFLDENGILRFYSVEEHEKNPGYIAIGAAITSYARQFTIRAAQANIKYFCYSDTDSIHLACKPEDVVGCVIHDKNFNCWKVESEWLRGWFVRTKAYIEETEKDEYDVKCAGMPQSCKDKFAHMVRKQDPEWIGCGYEDITAFRPGLEVQGKLVGRQVPGGLLLCETTYKFKQQNR